jgi:hypothetical protein
MDINGMDTPAQVFFYEHDFYVLSNFSSFRINWSYNVDFDTSEHAYHWLRFQRAHHLVAHHEVPEWRWEVASQLAELVKTARSAHAAFRIAQESKQFQRPDWGDVKVDEMRKVIRAKATQHEYVRRKLLATGDRELVENSWRDDFWGWGPNRNGQNMLGKLWMELRDELQADAGALSDDLPF